MSNGVDEWTWINLWILLLPLFSVSEADVTQGHHLMGKEHRRFQLNEFVSIITILTWDNKQSTHPWKKACSATTFQKRLCKDITVVVGCYHQENAYQEIIWFHVYVISL